MIKCEICGRKFNNYRSFSQHLRSHKITAKDYYDKFLKKENEGICPICGKKTDFYSISRGYAKFCSHRCARFGRRLSKESKIKISESHKGKRRSANTRKKLSEANKGKHLSEETKKKISETNKGKIKSEETRKKMSKAQKGKIISEETRKKLSKANKGKNNYMFGKHHSKEAKEKMSEANTEHWQNPEYREKVISNSLRANRNLPNKAEKKLDSILQAVIPNEFRYVGNGQVIILGKNPDFINVNGKKQIIELFGDYWHSGESGKERMELFKEYGYSTLIIWENELKNDIVSLYYKIINFSVN
jgi:very-short-patch-repair endonuclease/endogenous inhibitor of DNA gyrase (YacG/DUF329 family)